MKKINDITNLSSLLDNPQLVEWFFTKLKFMEIQNPTIHSSLEKNLYSADVMGTLLEKSDNELLLLMFTSLTSRFFEPYIEELVSRWKTMRGKAAFEALKIVEKLDLQKAVLLVDEFLNTPGSFEDFEKTSAVMEFVGDNEFEKRETLRDLLFDKLNSVENLFQREMYSRLAIRIMVKLDMDSLTDNFISFIIEGIKKQTLKNILEDFYYFGTSGEPFIQWYFNNQSDERVFTTLKTVFIDGVQLEHYEGVNHLSGKPLLSKALELLESAPGRTILCRSVKKSKDEWLNLINRSKFKKEFGNFLMALTLSDHLKESWDFDAVSMDDAVSLLKPPFTTLPWYDDLIYSLKKREKSLLEDVFKLEFSQCENLNRGVHLIKAAGDLSLTIFTDLFLNLLGGEIENETSLALGNALEKFGGAAAKYIKSSWKNLNVKQGLYAVEILSRLGDDDLSTYLIDGWEAMKDHHLKIWCKIVKTCGDPSMVKFIESKVEISPSLLDIGVLREAFLGLCNLLEITPPLLEVMKNHQLIQKERKKSSKPIINLELVCPLCNELSDYDVENIFVTIGFHMEHPYIGGDLKCHYCGRRPDFQLTRTGFSHYVQEFGKVANLLAASQQFESALKVVEPFLLDGARVSMPKTIAFFQSERERLPKDPSSALHLGHLYHKMKKLDDAIEQFKDTLIFDPSNIEATLFLGLIYEETGDFSEALSVMMKTLVYKNRWTFYISKKKDRKELSESFSSLYNHLLEKLSTQMPQVPVDFLLDQKVGKNSPCPCGSGKKYKRCCIRKNIY